MVDRAERGRRGRRRRPGFTIADDAGLVTALALEGDYVYWADDGASSIYRRRKDAQGAREVVVQIDRGQGIWDFGLDAGYVYVLAKDKPGSYDSHLYRVSRCGGAPRLLLDVHEAQRMLAVGSLFVYLATSYVPTANSITRVVK